MPAPASPPRGTHSCSVKSAWIPAFAGMTVRSDNRIGVDGIIPAFAGMTAETPWLGNVIGAEAGMMFPITHARAPDTPIASALLAFPRKRE